MDKMHVRKLERELRELDAALLTSAADETWLLLEMRKTVAAKLQAALACVVASVAA
jgi:hypothetical protein